MRVCGNSLFLPTRAYRDSHRDSSQVCVQPPALSTDPYPSGRKNCPERTGLLLGTERHCDERVYRVIASDIPPKRKNRPGRKVA
jgi:hypothetical protein